MHPKRLYLPIEGSFLRIHFLLVVLTVTIAWALWYDMLYDIVTICFLCLFLHVWIEQSQVTALSVFKYSDCLALLRALLAFMPHKNWSCFLHSQKYTVHQTRLLLSFISSNFCTPIGKQFPSRWGCIDWVVHGSHRFKSFNLVASLIYFTLRLC